MECTPGRRFVRSSCLRVVDIHTDSVTLVHQLSGKQYRLGKDAYALLDATHEPMTAEELRRQFPHVSAGEVDLAIEYLVRHQLLLEHGDGAPDETFHITSTPHTLFSLPRLENLNRPPTLVCWGVPYGRGNPVTSGCANAPSVLRRYSAGLKLDLRNLDPSGTDGALFDTDLEVSTSRLAKHMEDRRIADWGDLYVHPHEYPEHVYYNVERAAQLLVDHGHVPITIGGDHSITYSLLRAVAKRYDGLHVVHLDAHTDAYATGLDRAFQSVSSHHHGNFVARVLNEIPSVAVIHQLGIRGLHNVGTVQHPKQRIYFMRDTRRVISEGASSEFPLDAPYYLTVDVDVLAPSVGPGTATPVPGGLQYSELLQLLVALFERRRLVGVDVVELCPDKDPSGLTSKIVLELLAFVMNLVTC